MSLVFFVGRTEGMLGVGLSLILVFLRLCSMVR